MSTTTSRNDGDREHRVVRRTVPTAALIAVAMVVLIGTAPAYAYWRSGGTASATAVTATLSAPAGVTVPATATGDVQVSWTPGAGGVDPDGYFVTRHSGGSTAAACGSGPESLIQGTSCADTAVADGEYSYTVTAVFRSWTATGPGSDLVAVTNGSALAFSTQPSDVGVGAPITPSVAVALQTADGDPVARAGVMVSMAIGDNPADGVLVGDTTAVTGSDGVAVFDGLAIDQPGADYTLSASSPGLTTAASQPFTVDAPAFRVAARTSLTPSTTTASPTTPTSTPAAAPSTSSSSSSSVPPSDPSRTTSSSASRTPSSASTPTLSSVSVDPPVTPTVATTSGPSTRPRTTSADGSTSQTSTSSTTSTAGTSTTETSTAGNVTAETLTAEQELAAETSTTDATDQAVTR